MFNILRNTVEGVAEVAINTVKAPIGVLTIPIDDGETLKESVEGILEGLSKVGSTEKE